ncbi:MAG: sulfatase-like hydrolase/transferase [Gammaproteobacteria bacterium]
MYARQVEQVIDARFQTHELPPAPSVVASDFKALGGADVYLVFFESYGATVLDEPDRAQALQPSYAALTQTCADTGWSIASALLDSTTFGGSSWLAHSSVMTGSQIDGPQRYEMILASTRTTLARRFKAAGYRTLALMPGLKQAWPEGDFYGFDDIVPAARIDYRGPAFGWWAIPDQYTLDWLYRNAIAKPDRQPLFVFYPTVMSHAPFSPTPPYQPDWSRLTTSDPFPAEQVSQVFARSGWRDPSASYIGTIHYNLAVLAGFLRERLHDNALIVVLGDHQPPAIVSGVGASHAVPVHVLSRDPALLDVFLRAGFKAGVLPQRPAVGGIEELYGLILAAADSRKTRE